MNRVRDAGRCARRIRRENPGDDETARRKEEQNRGRCGHCPAAQRAVKAQAQKQLQDKCATEDASGICTFTTFVVTPDKLYPMYNAATGENVSLEEWLAMGDRIWNLERLFNNRAGLSRKDDSLPPRMTREPLTNGAVQNQVVELAPMLEEYYRLRGWDEDGNPNAETLARLGIG